MKRIHRLSRRSKAVRNRRHGFNRLKRVNRIFSFLLQKNNNVYCASVSER